MILTRPTSHENFRWGEVNLLYKGEEYHFPYHILTGEVFNYDPRSLIRLKCVALTGLTPFVTVVRSIYWLAQSIFEVFSAAYNYLDGESMGQNTRIKIVEAVFNSGRALKYGALMTKCAFVGIFSPYGGRQHYGQLERELNGHLDGPHRDKFYLAFCFQRLYVMSKEDPQNNEHVINKLTKHMAQIDAIWDAIWVCSYRQLMIELKLMKSDRL